MRTCPSRKKNREQDVLCWDICRSAAARAHAPPIQYGRVSSSSLYSTIWEGHEPGAIMPKYFKSDLRREGLCDYA